MRYRVGFASSSWHSWSPESRRRFRPGASSRSTVTRTDRQSVPAVASDATGNFVVVWASLTAGRSVYGVFGQRYDASGAPRGAEFQVNTYTTLAIRSPSPWPRTPPATSSWSGGATGRTGAVVASSPSATTPRVRAVGRVPGQHLHDRPPVPGGRGLRCRRQLRRGLGELRTGRERLRHLRPALRRRRRAPGSEFQVNTTTAGYQAKPYVASDAAGNFVVVWSSAYQDGST